MKKKYATRAFLCASINLQQHKVLRLRYSRKFRNGKTKKYRQRPERNVKHHSVLNRNLEGLDLYERIESERRALVAMDKRPVLITKARQDTWDKQAGSPEMERIMRCNCCSEAENLERIERYRKKERARKLAWGESIRQFNDSFLR